MDSCDLLCFDLEVAEVVRASLDSDRAAVLSGLMKVVADPTRLLIIQALGGHELCGCDLGWVTGQSEKVVSHHLGRLRREGMVVTRREGKVVFARLGGRGRELLAMVEGVATDTG